MDVGSLIARVKRVELKTRRLSDQIFSGSYHSAFKGQGMSFSEVREYSPGDEVRSIDWNVTARTGIPHVKVFEEERELTVLLMVDISASAFTGSTGMMRKDLIVELCALLALSAGSNNDKVGLLLFSSEVELYIPPKKGRQHILRLIREIIQVNPVKKTTSIHSVLEFSARVIKKKAICFLISDFLDQGFDSALKIVSQKHDLIGLWCLDAIEKQFPDVGLIYIEDVETGKRRLVDTSSHAFKEANKSAAETRRIKLNTLFQRSGADLVTIPLHESYINPLVQFFSKRRM